MTFGIFVVMAIVAIVMVKTWNSSTFVIAE